MFSQINTFIASAGWRKKKEYWACRLETPHIPALHVGAKETFLEYMPLHVLDRERKSGLIIGFQPFLTNQSSTSPTSLRPPPCRCTVRFLAASPSCCGFCNCHPYTSIQHAAHLAPYLAIFMIHQIVRLGSTLGGQKGGRLSHLWLMCMELLGQMQGT